MRAPPIAKRVPRKLEAHGHIREDPFHWLNRRDDPEVLSYLEAENAYADAVLSKTEDLRDALFSEIKNRIKPDDASVPYRKDGYYYYHRFEEGKEYAVHCRKKGSLDAEEEILADGNALAEGHDFFSLSLSGVSDDGGRLAYAVDTVGRRFYTVYFKDLDSGELLGDVLRDVTGQIAWANDHETVFYTRQHPQTLRSYRVYRHRLGTDPANDVCVYEEADESFHLYVAKTKSRRFLFIACAQTVTTEYRFLPADTPFGEFVVLQPRERDHEYGVRHLGDSFFILSNKNAPNFRLLRTPVDSPAIENWEEVLPHREDVLLEGLDLFRDHLVVVERHEGLRRIRILPFDGSDEHYLEFDEPAYSAHLAQNHELDSHCLRYGYTSLTTPGSTYDYDMRNRSQVLLKQEEVLGGFDRASYTTERLWAVSADGARVPISLVRRKDTELAGKPPLLLYGYGSYGITADAAFSAARLSLLDRGFVFAIAHIRGSEMLGRKWYDAGRLLEKKNTFADFVGCAEHLLEHGYAHPRKLFAIGGSAGGLLLGAVANMRPDLFRGLVVHVPFVDIVTSMLDGSIPLTTGEYDEWGNPAQREHYDYMLSYSPYDNVERKDYPHMLVTAGLHDSQVQFWEPAKWVAKLRAMKTDGNELLLKTYMSAGHHGPSGRYRQHEETALAYAFLIELAGRE